MIRDLQRKLDETAAAAQEALALWIGRAQELHGQKPKDKNKLYALYAPELECLSKGKARRPYEFGVKVGVAVAAKRGLIVGARSFPNNPYDGDTLAEQLEQVEILSGQRPSTALVDLGYRGREVDGVAIAHRGKAKTLTRAQKRWLRRRQAVEPVIGNLKADHRMDRCRLKGALGDAMHAIACAAGYKLRWLMRWIVSFCASVLTLLAALLVDERQSAVLSAR